MLRLLAGFTAPHVHRLGVPRSILPTVKRLVKNEKLKHLLVVAVLEAALDLHMIVPSVGESLLNTELKRLLSNSKIVNVIIFEFCLSLMFLIIFNQ